MAVVDEKLVNQALSLPSEMRAILINRLLESLNLKPNPKVDTLWAIEAEKRITEDY